MKEKMFSKINEGLKEQLNQFTDYSSSLMIE